MKHIHHCVCVRYLFIILQLIVEYDSIWLVWLRPGESDAVDRTTDLVHYRHRRRSWKKCRQRDILLLTEVVQTLSLNQITEQ